MLMLCQIHPPSDERHAFHLQPQPLFLARLESQLNFPTRSNYSLPWNSSLCL
jgi:hypothetical protein